MIPPDPALWQLDQFENFIEERKKLIKTKFAHLLSVPPTPAPSPIIANDDPEHSPQQWGRGRPREVVGGAEMLKKTELREAALNWIRSLPHGREFDNQDLYTLLENNYPDECSHRGDAANEPRYKNDARWAVQDAKNNERIIGETGIRGRFRRL